jgi:hypothetical protein
LAQFQGARPCDAESFPEILPVFPYDADAFAEILAAFPHHADGLLETRRSFPQKSDRISPYIPSNSYLTARATSISESLSEVPDGFPEVRASFRAKNG